MNLTVDNTAPTAVMYQPTPLAGYSYARSNGPTTLQVHASDAYGVKSVQFTVDGTPVGVLLAKPDTSGGYLYTLTFDTSTLTAGLHSISALVTDNAGNTTNATALSLKSGPITYVPVLATTTGSKGRSTASRTSTTRPPSRPMPSSRT